MEKMWSVQKVIEAIDKDELILYVGNGVDMDTTADKRIVLFTNELKRTGAPSVLLNMSGILSEMGFKIVPVICKLSC